MCTLFDVIVRDDVQKSIAENNIVQENEHEIMKER